MVLLGITGPIGHGKTTFASYLAQQNPQAHQIESSYVISEVADRLNKFFVWESPRQQDILSVNRWLAHLPAIVSAVTHAHIGVDDVTLTEQDIVNRPQDYEKLWDYLNAAHKNPEITSEYITSYNKEAYRPLLQWLGGFLVKHVDEGIWYNELVRRATEAQAYGCQLFIIGGVRFPGDAKILRKAKGIIIEIQRPGLDEPDMKDPTERERHSIQPDVVVINNGSLEQLLDASLRLYQDIAKNKLKEKYYAASVPAR